MEPVAIVLGSILSVAKPTTLERSCIVFAGPPGSRSFQDSTHKAPADKRSQMSMREPFPDKVAPASRPNEDAPPMRDSLEGPLSDALSPLELAMQQTDDIGLQTLKAGIETKSRAPVTITPLKKDKNQRVATFFRALLWIALVALHIFCAAFYGSGAYVYHNLPGTTFNIEIVTYKLTINPKFFPVIAAFNGIFSAAHLICFFEIIIRSVLARELVFHRSQRIKRSTKTHFVKRKSIIADKLNQLRTGSKATMTRLSQDSRISTASFKVQSIAKRASIVWDNSFGHAGVFGIGGKYFSVLFLVRETVECILQSTQAAQMSNNIPRVWFNRFGVVVVAINCWTTPVVQHLFKKNPQLELMLCVLFDVILDAISSVGVTTILAAQYIPDYDPSITNFSSKCWQNIEWQSFMLTEFRQLFVQSWFDFATRFLFALTTIFCMDDVKILASASVDIVVRHEGGASETRLQFWNRRVEKVFHVVMVAWGFVILGLHIEASCAKNVPDCAVMLNPWVASKPACSCMYIDCIQRETPIMGTAAELNAIWKTIEAKKLIALSIVICPNLHIPPSFQSFQGLTILEIVACGVQEWEEDAALTNTHHPNMRTFGLAFSNLSAYDSVLPPGLTNPDFPKYLKNMCVGACGLTDLPHNLDTIWPKIGLNLLVPNNRFERVPDVLLRMDFLRLNLDFNLIQELPAQLFEQKLLWWLDVVNNPLTQFPADVTPSPALSIVNFAMTNVSSLPNWMTTSSFLKQTTMYGSQTPLCRNNSVDPAIWSHLNCQVPPVLILG